MIKYITKTGELLRSSDYFLREIDVEPFYDVVSCKTGKAMKCGFAQGGYIEVGLKFNGKRKTCFLHRLILSTFDPIGYFDGADVNHIDEDKTNNKLSNLEWLSRKDNINYGTHNQRMAESNLNCKVTSKPVLQFTKSGEFVAEYPSAMEAHRQTKLIQTNICACCRGTRKSTGGYVWEYKD